MELGPEHLTAAGLLGAAAGKLVEQLPRLVRLAFNAITKKPKPKSAAEQVAELRGEVREFKRAILDEAKVARERYHNLRAPVMALRLIDQERKAARARGERFDTGAYNLEDLYRRLEHGEDAPLPQLTPPGAKGDPEDGEL